MKELKRAIGLIMAFAMLVSALGINTFAAEPAYTDVLEGREAADETELASVSGNQAEEETETSEEQETAEPGYAETKEEKKFSEETGDIEEYPDVLEIEAVEVALDEIEGKIYEAEELLTEDEPSISIKSVSYGVYWDEYSSYYIYNQLGDDERKLWSAMEVLYSGYLENEADFTDAFTDYIRINTTEITVEELTALVGMFRYSHPQYYYLMSGYRYSVGNSYVMIANKVYDAFVDGGARKTATNEIKSQLDMWLATINTAATEEAKIRKINDLICNKVSYNYDAVNQGIGNVEQNQFTQSAYSVFCMDKTVCAGYTQAFTWLCNGAGMDAFGVTSPGHAWNKVNVNDNWYNIDCTWNDNGGTIYYHCYLKSDEAIDALGSHDEEEVWNGYLPACTLDSRSSYSVVGALPTITQRVQIPVITVQKTDTSYRVEITTVPENATIYYTLDGQIPTEGSSKGYRYKGVFELNETATIKAFAVCDQYLDSEVIQKEIEHIYYMVDTGSCGDNITWQLDSSGTLVIKGSGKMQDFASEASQPWYAYKDQIIDIQMDSTITSIGNYAFFGFSNLECFNIPEGIEAIGSYAFYGTGLTAIEIPAKITGLGRGVFAECGNLERLTIAGDIQVVQDRIFYNCVKLHTVNLSADLKTISSQMFFNCSALQSITLPENLEKIGTQSFGYCSKLKEIIIPQKVNTIEAYAFSGCTALETVEIMAELNKISTYLFKGCSKLRDIVIPETVTRIGASAFAGCTALTQLYIPQGVTDIGENAIDQTTAIKGYPGSSAEAYADSNGNEFIPMGNQEVEVRFVTNTDEEIQPINYPKNSRITPPELSGRPGYTLGKWYTSNEQQDETTEWDFSQDRVTQDITLYAQWIANEYTVSFDPNGGLVEITEKTVTYDGVYGELPAPAREGYSFTGWYTEPEGNNRILSETRVEILANQTLYAHWEYKYTVEKPTASPSADTEVEAGTKIYLSTKTNGAQIYYTTDSSIGMAVSPENGGILYEEAITVTKEIRIYAVAVKENYKSSEVAELAYTVKEQPQEWGEVTVEDRNELGLDTAEDIPDGLWVAGVKDCDYTGESIVHSKLHVYNHKTQLIPSVDYTIKYTNNIKAGTATVTISGKGNYTGTITRTFTIRPLDLSQAEAANVTLPYNGKVQKSTTTISYDLNGTRINLKKGTDFTYSYPGTDAKAEDYDSEAFKAVGDYEVILTGKGNYTGTLKFTQTITAKYVIGKLSLGKIPNQLYDDGNELQPEIVLKNGKYQLEEGLDFEVSYENNAEVGTAGVTITGIGEYAGTRTTTFKITGRPLSKAKISGFMSALPWTGNSVEQRVEITYPTGSKTENGADILKENTDYTVRYQKNTEVGTATVIYTGKGGYTGSIKKTYKITGISMSKVIVSGLKGTQEYAGKPVIQDAYALSYTTEEGDTLPLNEGTDYEVTYENHNKAGTAFVIFTGKGGYTGKIKKNYKITAYNLKGDKISVLEIPEQKYTKSGVQPKPSVTYTGEEGDVVLEEGKDYTLSYSNHKTPADKASVKAPTVIITGKGGYKGKVSKTFTIVEGDLADIEITAGDVVYQNKGNICKPAIALYDTNGKKLTAGTDYDKAVTYTYAKDVRVTRVVNKEKKDVIRLPGEKVDNQDIIPVGTEIIATVQGIKNYTGSKSVIFRYVSGNLDKASVIVAEQEYSGKPVEPDKNDLTVKIGKTVLAKTDYQIVGFSDNIAKGTGKITIRGIGNYGGQRTINFKISTKTMNYTVTYEKNAQEATGKMNTSVITVGSKLAANTYKRKGYVFAGWNTRQDGMGETYSDKEAFYLKNTIEVYGRKVTLYAQWKEN